ncbi:MAG: hypothetical protein A3E87_09565 [Gammaproteobacteria bacterium RIFCSPHIGHO2_12_FULL_35_23]|nr:MAG: hypothetical protein A3E87_09565 [Gammaproteobacteria bacterium RIFCSPHIGHO2_12_FULL_35_23]
MLARFLPAILRGILTFLVHILAILSVGSLVYILGLLKYLIPIKSWQRKCDRWLNTMPVLWTDINDWGMRLLTQTEIKIIGGENLTRNDWYLLTANHCSWTDVLILYRVFNHRLPVLKFFMKSQLLWVPILGWGCWLIGYPFMKRYTKEQIAKKPSLKGKDLATTKKLCQRFKQMPMTIISFAEGTRYTAEKAKRQKTPFKHLLKPRAGGLAYTLMTMEDYLHQFINVTLIYREGRYKYWDYLTGRLKQVVIIVKTQPINKEMLGDYVNDREYRVKFQEWLNQLWIEKDKEIDNYWQ